MALSRKRATPRVRPFQPPTTFQAEQSDISLTLNSKTRWRPRSCFPSFSHRIRVPIVTLRLSILRQTLTQAVTRVLTSTCPSPPRALCPPATLPTPPRPKKYAASQNSKKHTRSLAKNKSARLVRAAYRPRLARRQPTKPSPPYIRIRRAPLPQPKRQTRAASPSAPRAAQD